MLGFKPPMETIEEQNPESPRSAKSMKMPAGQSLDGVLQTITSPGKKPRPSPVFMDTNVWHGRSRSTSDVPPARKPSQRVREWMKRSKSARTFRSMSDSESPEKERILKIDHLGGGRVGGIDADTPITIGLAELAVSMRSPKPRWQAGSPESRVTQWIDLYPEALEAFSPTYPPEGEPGPLTSHDPREPKEPQEADHDEIKPPEDDDDLHPAPLRCPSVEKKELEAAKDRDSSDAKAVDNTKPSIDKSTPQPTPDAKPNDGPRWKPLPNLPHGPSPSITETASSSIVVKKVKKPSAQPREPGQTITETSTTTKLEIKKKKPKPQTQPTPLGTPPTPDSARATGIPDKPRAQSRDTRDSADSKASKSSAQSTPSTPTSTPASASIPIPILPPAPIPVPAAVPVQIPVPVSVPVPIPILVPTTIPTPKAEAEAEVKETKPHTVHTIHTIQHTRRERVWLHANYRGEAPFLQAWGLDIKVPGDREVGLEILRDLMLAEEEREI